MSEQSSVKYNKIVMLVHPFYNLIFSYFTYKRHIFNLVNRKITDDAVFLNGHQRNFKILLGAYGKALLDAAKDPKTCFIIVEPNFKGVLKSRYDPKLESMYYRITAKFFDRLKKVFGDRIYFTNYVPHTESRELISLELLNKIEKMVALESFGEFTDDCVVIWRDDYLKKLLTQKGFEVYESRTNRNYSLQLSLSDPVGLELKFIRMQRDRRKLRRKLAEPYKGPKML